jgi:hypothetical protein
MLLSYEISITRRGLHIGSMAIGIRSRAVRYGTSLHTYGMLMSRKYITTDI